MTGLVLQGRLDSSRLPGKSLLPLGGRPLIFRVMEAFGGTPWDVKVLACPEDCVSAFAPLAEEAGFEIQPGPREDVLARYCLAVRRFGLTRVIRATGDNPFVFADAAELINRETLSLGADYGGYHNLPWGAGVESTAAAALLRAEAEARSPPEREHVTPYLYHHPEFFRLHRPEAPPQWRCPEIRLTVDTGEDYARAELLFEGLRDRTDRHGGETIIAVYRNLFPAPDRAGPS
jgi:spore coat polysaccharide biosynthesis protein SpsF